MSRGVAAIHVPHGPSGGSPCECITLAVAAANSNFYATVVVDSSLAGARGDAPNAVESGIRILEEGFSKRTCKRSSEVLMNQTAIRLMGFKDPIGQTVKIRGRERRIVGVIDDVLMGSPLTRSSLPLLPC